MRDGPDRAQVRLGVLDHGSEFEDREPPPVEANPNLAIQDRASVRDKNHDCDDGQQRREQDQGRSRQNDVDYTFGKTVWSSDRSMPAVARSAEQPLENRSVLP